MAKLSARGRKEVVRLSHAGEVDRELVSWEKVTVALMSDNTVLEKRDVRFRSDGRPHTWGWKVRGKLAQGKTPAQWEAAYRAKGYA